MQQPVVHVIFTEDGLPRWFGPEPVKDSARLDLEDLRALLPADAPESALASSWQGFLITHRKVGGMWVPREVGATDAERPDPAGAADPEPLSNAGLAAGIPGVDGPV